MSDVPVDTKALIGDVVSKMTSGRVAPDGGAPAPQPAPVPAPVVTPAPAPVPVPGKIPTPPDSLFGKKPDPAPAPVADPVLPTDADISSMPPKDAKAAKAMRARIESQNAMIADLQKKTQTPANTEEISTLKKQNEELLNQIDRIALEQSPRFRSRFDAPRNAILDQIKVQLKAFEVDESVAMEAVKLPLKERMELLKEHAADIAPALYDQLLKVDALEQARSAELAKSSDTRKADEVEQERQVAEFKTKAFTDVLGMAREANHFAFIPVEGNEDWNKVVNETISTAQQLFNSNNPQDQAAGLLLGAAAPVYLDLYKRERQERERLEGVIKQYQKAMPRVGGGQPPAGDDGIPVPKEGRMSPRDAASATLGKLFPSSI